MDRIVAFDVETPNYNNDRICSIGITFIENGEIIEPQHYLINPECGFDYRNIQIHGIRPEDITDAPTFPEIWDKISVLFHTNLIAAHNAAFDLRVLGKTLYKYGIIDSLVYYVDTMVIARSTIREIENYKLPTLCKRFGITLNHHNAGSDSYACAVLLCCLLNAGANLDNYIKPFSLDAVNVPKTEREPRRISTNSQSLLTLNNILSKITCDNVLVKGEIDYLHKWLDDNITLNNNYPYNKIYTTLSTALADGILSQSKLDNMMHLFKQIVDPVNENASNYERLDIQGKNICLSGEFDYGSKMDVKERLTMQGAYINETITLRTNMGAC